MPLLNKPYFHSNDKITFSTPDLSIDWDSVNLASPISRDSAGLVHPFVDGEEFVGILSNKNVKNNSDSKLGVNSIEASYLKGGYVFSVFALETLADGDWVIPANGGFTKTTTKADAVGRVVFGGAKGDLIKVRGGNY